MKSQLLSESASLVVEGETCPILAHQSHQNEFWLALDKSDRGKQRGVRPCILCQNGLLFLFFTYYNYSIMWGNYKSIYLGLVLAADLVALIDNVAWVFQLSV